MFLYAFAAAADPSQKNAENSLVELAKSGDEQAFETLVKKYETFVCAACLAVLHDREDAFDASQEAFLKVWRSLPAFKGDSAFSSWLYRIAKNTALDMLRAKKRKPAFSLTDDDDEVRDVPDTSDTVSPEKALLSGEKRTVLANALQKLNEEHRAVIRLRDIEGFSYGEIAEKLGIEEGTVKSRLFRARSALRDILTAENYF